MELGIDKRKIESIKGRGRKIAADPILLRCYLSVGLLVVGALAFERPQVASLGAARKRNEEAKSRADTSDEIFHLERQIKNCAPQLVPSADLVDWGNYVLSKLQQSGAMLHSMEPKKTVTAGPFKVVEIDVTAKGTYEDLVDFIDRLERGERAVRIDRLFMQRLRATITLECTIKGLVKPPKMNKDGAEKDGAKPARKPAAGSEPAAEPATKKSEAPNG